jgi:hypothetical protein
VLRLVRVSGVLATVAGLAVTVLVMASVLAADAPRQPASIGPASAGESPEPSVTPSPEPSAVPQGTGDCPVTIPPQPGFVPPKPFPPQLPDLYQSVWYGTAELWTMLSPEGEIWELPYKDADGTMGDKMLWWTTTHPAEQEPSPLIIITGRRLDRPGSFETGTGGPCCTFREDIGSFMVMGIEIPAGCWELTARYGEAQLSYVMLVMESRFEVD